MKEEISVKDETCGTCASCIEKSSECTGFRCVDERSHMYGVSEGDPACEHWSERSEQMIFQKTWEEFQNTGLLWFVNRILHMFGWAIVIVQDVDGGPVSNTYPARCKFRGFDDTTEIEKFEQVARYMRDNGKELYDEADYEEDFSESEKELA